MRSFSPKHLFSLLKTITILNESSPIWFRLTNRVFCNSSHFKLYVFSTDPIYTKHFPKYSFIFYKLLRIFFSNENILYKWVHSFGWEVKLSTFTNLNLQIGKIKAIFWAGLVSYWYYITASTHLESILLTVAFISCLNCSPDLSFFLLIGAIPSISISFVWS